MTLCSFKKIENRTSMTLLASWVYVSDGSNPLAYIGLWSEEEMKTDLTPSLAVLILSSHSLLRINRPLSVRLVDPNILVLYLIKRKLSGINTIYPFTLVEKKLIFLSFYFHLNALMFILSTFSNVNVDILIIAGGRYGQHDAYSEGFAYDGAPPFQTVPTLAGGGSYEWAADMSSPHPAFLSHHPPSTPDSKALLNPPIHPSYTGIFIELFIYFHNWFCVITRLCDVNT